MKQVRPILYQFLYTLVTRAYGYHQICVDSQRLLRTHSRSHERDQFLYGSIIGPAESQRTRYYVIAVLRYRSSTVNLYGAPI